MTRPMKVKRNVSKTGKLLAGYIPKPIVDGIMVWVSRNPERDVSTFIRESAREKLRRDRIPFNEETRSNSIEEGK